MQRRLVHMYYLFSYQNRKSKISRRSIYKKGTKFEKLSVIYNSEQFVKNKNKLNKIKVFRS